MDELKICSKCFTPKHRSEFYKHRASCKACKIKYQLNRYHDLKDGKRDKLSWYESHKALEEPRAIDSHSKRKDTNVSLITERELRCDNSDHSKKVAYVFILVWLVIAGVILNELGVF